MSHPLFPPLSTYNNGTQAPSSFLDTVSYSPFVPQGYSVSSYQNGVKFHQNTAEQRAEFKDRYSPNHPYSPLSPAPAIKNAPQLPTITAIHQRSFSSSFYSPDYFTRPIYDARLLPPALSSFLFWLTDRQGSQTTPPPSPLRSVKKTSPFGTHCFSTYLYQATPHVDKVSNSRLHRRQAYSGVGRGGAWRAHVAVEQTVDDILSRPAHHDGEGFVHDYAWTLPLIPLSYHYAIDAQSYAAYHYRPADGQKFDTAKHYHITHAIDRWNLFRNPHPADFLPPNITPEQPATMHFTQSANWTRKYHYENTQGPNPWTNAYSFSFPYRGVAKVLAQPPEHRLSYTPTTHLDAIIHLHQLDRVRSLPSIPAPFHRARKHANDKEGDEIYYLPDYLEARRFMDPLSPDPVWLPHKLLLPALLPNVWTPNPHHPLDFYHRVHGELFMLYARWEEDEAAYRLRLFLYPRSSAPSMVKRIEDQLGRKFPVPPVDSSLPRFEAYSRAKHKLYKESDDIIRQTMDPLVLFSRTENSLLSQGAPPAAIDLSNPMRRVVAEICFGLHRSIMKNPPYLYHPGENTDYQPGTMHAGPRRNCGPIKPFMTPHDFLPALYERGFWRTIAENKNTYGLGYACFMGEHLDMVINPLRPTPDIRVKYYWEGEIDSGLEGDHINNAFVRDNLCHLLR